MSKTETQSEALRLANEFEICTVYESLPSINDVAKAAAELRRLDAENKAHKADVMSFHYAMKDAGWHPGRTDDLLTDIIRAKGEEMKRMEAENKALRADAARYRWLRVQPDDCSAPRIDICQWTCEPGDSANNGEGLRGEAADQAIDAAMAAAKIGGAA